MPIFTGLPPAVWPVAAESPAVEEFIEDEDDEETAGGGVNDVLAE